MTINRPLRAADCARFNGDGDGRCPRPEVPGISDCAQSCTLFEWKSSETPTAIEVPDLIPRPPVPRGERAVRVLALLDEWHNGRVALDEVDHDEFFKRLYEVIVGCEPVDERGAR